MPNNIANRLKVIGKDINEIEDFLDFICGEDEGVIVDFNNIVPIPQCLKNTEESTLLFDCLEYYLQQVGETELVKQLKPYFTSLKDFSSYDKETLEELYAKGERYYNNYKECGYFTWYKWRIDNWGTKWNAYESNIVNSNNNEVDIIFYTAWAGVPDLINILADKFPHLYFEYDYADEDCGYNSGSGRGCVNDDVSIEAINTYIYAHDYDRKVFYEDNKEWLCKEDWFNEKEWE